jgi:chromosome segregation ATPase
MVSLEQVKLLETKVARAIEYLERAGGEKEALLLKEAELQGKLESYQKRIDELEVHLRRFKEDQSRIEEGILSALDRLNQFEDAIEKSLSGKKDVKAGPGKSGSGLAQAASAKAGKKASAAGKAPEPDIPEAEPIEDDEVEDPLTELPPADDDDEKTSANGELDIF